MIRTDIGCMDSGWFAYAPADYMVQSIRAGTTHAQVYVDRPEAPAIAVVHEQYTVFLHGTGAPKEQARAAVFLRDKIFTGDVRRRLGGVKILFGQDASWRACLGEAFAAEQAVFLSRRAYRHDEPPASSSPAEGIMPVTQALLADPALQNRDMILKEVEEMWGSAEAFLQSGFGVCAVTDSAVAGFCTAEYVSPGLCGIGIATAGAHRRKGYALAMTKAFLAACAARKVTPFWECWANNEASVRTAERSGFVRVSDYEVLLVTF